MARLVPALIVAGAIAVYPIVACAEQIPGFSPGIWTFPQKAAPTAGEIAESCRTFVTIVTPPNDAITVVFEAIDPPGSVAGKSLQGKITFRESCPPFSGESLICPGRDLISGSLLPVITQYRFKKLSGGRYEVTSQQKDSEAILLHPVLCPKDVLEDLIKSAIIPEEAGLKP